MMRGMQTVSLSLFPRLKKDEDGADRDPIRTYANSAGLQHPIEGAAEQLERVERALDQGLLIVTDLGGLEPLEKHAPECGLGRAQEPGGVSDALKV